MENMEPPPAADYVVDSVYGSRAVNLPLQKMFLVQITNKSIGRQFADRSFGVLVDRNNHTGIFHASQMLYRA